MRNSILVLVLVAVTSIAHAETRPKPPGSRTADAGQVLSIMGSAITVAGVLMLVVPRAAYPGFFTCTPNEPCYMDIPAATVGGVGVVANAVGVPLWIAGEKRKSAFARHQVALSVSNVRNGGVSTTTGQLSLRF